MVCSVPETYAPAILRARAAKKRKETGDSRWWSRYDDKKSIFELLKINLSRPFVMAATEPIWYVLSLFPIWSSTSTTNTPQRSIHETNDELISIFWNLYVAVVYAVLYLCFVAYPIVFGQLRHWQPGFVGLAYLGIGVGSLFTIGLEPVFRRMINSHKIDPATGRVPPEAMVSVVCIASLLIPIGELVFAWTCTPNVHWIVPIIAGIPFGAGNAACFIYASNYLVHSYGIYAASALAGNSVLRSILGGTLPLAGPKLYASLGPHWAGTLLAFLEFALVPIPFIFYRYGDRIRKKSHLISQMQADKDKLEGKMNAAREKAALKALDDQGRVEKGLLDVIV
jgi:hypothetical protein